MNDTGASGSILDNVASVIRDDAEPWYRDNLFTVYLNYDKFLKGGAINMSIILGIAKQCPESNCIFDDKSRISQICL